MDKHGIICAHLILPRYSIYSNEALKLKVQMPVR